MDFESAHVFRPAGGSATTLLLLHEAGGDENALVPVARGLAPRAAVLSPRGQVTEGGEARFFASDGEGILAQASALETWVRDAADRYEFDVTRVVALGYSDGASMAAALLLLYPHLLAGAVLLRGTLPVEPEALLPIASTPVLILAGQHDVVVPTQATERLAQTLSYAGAQVEVRWGNVGHELAPEDFTAASEFLKSLG